MGSSHLQSTPAQGFWGWRLGAACVPGSAALGNPHFTSISLHVWVFLCVFLFRFFLFLFLFFFFNKEKKRCIFLAMTET